MQYVAREEARKVAERELKKSKQLRHAQVREQTIVWTEEIRRSFEDEKERQIILLSEALTAQAQANAMARIEQINIQHDLAMAKIGAAHRAASELREAQQIKELKRLQSGEIAKQRGNIALKSHRIDAQKRAEGVTNVLKRKEQVRKIEDMKAKDLVERRPFTVSNAIAGADRKQDKLGPPDYQQTIAKTLRLAPAYQTQQENSKTPVAKTASHRSQQTKTAGEKDNDGKSKFRKLEPASGAFANEAKLRQSNRDNANINPKTEMPKVVEQAAKTKKVKQIKKPKIKPVLYYDASVPITEVKYKPPSGLVEKIKKDSKTSNAWDTANIAKEELKEKESKLLNFDDQEINDDNKSMSQSRGKKALKLEQLSRELRKLTHELTKQSRVEIPKSLSSAQLGLEDNSESVRLTASSVKEPAPVLKPDDSAVKYYTNNILPNEQTELSLSSRRSSSSSQLNKKSRVEILKRVSSAQLGLEDNSENDRFNASLVKVPPPVWKPDDSTVKTADNILSNEQIGLSQRSRRSSSSSQSSSHSTAFYSPTSTPLTSSRDHTPTRIQDIREDHFDHIPTRIQDTSPQQDQLTTRIQESPPQQNQIPTRIQDTLPQPDQIPTKIQDTPPQQDHIPTRIQERQGSIKSIDKTDNKSLNREITLDEVKTKSIEESLKSLKIDASKSGDPSSPSYDLTTIRKPMTGKPYSDSTTEYYSPPFTSTPDESKSRISDDSAFKHPLGKKESKALHRYVTKLLQMRRESVDRLPISVSASSSSENSKVMADSFQSEWSSYANTPPSFSKNDTRGLNSTLASQSRPSATKGENDYVPVRHSSSESTVANISFKIHPLSSNVNASPHLFGQNHESPQYFSNHSPDTSLEIKLHVQSEQRIETVTSQEFSSNNETGRQRSLGNRSGHNESDYYNSSRSANGGHTSGTSTTSRNNIYSTDSGRSLQNVSPFIARIRSAGNDESNPTKTNGDSVSGQKPSGSDSEKEVFRGGGDSVGSDQKLWHSPIYNMVEHAEMLSSVFGELRNQWANISIERPPWCS